MPTPTCLDLSHHNTISSWPAVAAAGIKGVIHKATESTTFTDQLYAARRIEAPGSILWGAYHFIRPGRIAQQADFFLSVAKPDDHTLLAVDHEDRGVSVDDLLLFMDIVEQRTSRSILLYSGYVIAEQGAQGFTDAQVDLLSQRRFWLAEYTNGNPSWLSDIWPEWWLWQYAGSVPAFPGRIKGVFGYVDLDAYDGEDLAGEWSGT